MAASDYYLYLCIYLFAVNASAFAASGLDKRAARRRKRRTPEKALFLLAFLGGSAGLFLSMLVFRHKTKHWRFVIGVPALMLLQLVLLYFLSLK